jgi:hypothetical protein
MRLLIGGLGLIFGLVGFMTLTMAWINNAPTFISWIILAAGIAMWIYSMPALRMKDKEYYRQLREKIEKK